MKKSWFRIFIKRLAIVLCVACVLCYAIGCMLPWLSASNFWVFGYIGIAFPYIALSMIGWIIFWLFTKRKYALMLLLIFCLGYKQLAVIFSFNSNTLFKPEKENYNIRVISWNIGNLSGRPQNTKQKRNSVEDIVAFINKQNADVVCLQEFEDCRNGCKSVELLKKKYPHCYFPSWVIGKYKHGSGNVIFSKNPIVATDSVSYQNGENIITASIAFENDTIAFYTTHLDSYRFSKQEFKEIDAVGKDENLSKKNVKGIFTKLKNTFKTHAEQAEVITQFMSQATQPVIFCADLNEIPNNNTYWKVKGEKQDAFLQKGFGLGKTFNSLSPALRIDYIMPDNNFSVTQFDVKDEAMSDHSLLVCDLVLKKYLSEKKKK